MGAVGIPTFPTGLRQIKQGVVPGSTPRASEGGHGRCGMRKGNPSMWIKSVNNRANIVVQLYVT